MSGLNGKKVLLGVTGAIAAYKAADLVRRLQDAGAEIRVMMTENATRFVTPLTFQALSGHPVYTRMFESNERGMEHIDLARWADLILIAPASADFLAKLSWGHADNLLLTTCLAAGVPVCVAPAMNQQMWKSAATQENIARLRQRPVHIFGPGEGSQACGETGAGRMLEPLELVARCEKLFTPGVLAGKTVLITAGPTREAIDPVRFISNHSSGKMGYALAQAAIDAGANVILVSGPVSGLTVPAKARVVRVTTAQDMRDAVMGNIHGAHIFIAAAAVSDYRPKVVNEEKIKKTEQEMQVELIRNPDILTDVAALSPRPFCVGFAAETENLEENALNKLERKAVDMIAANWVGEAALPDGIGFDSDENALHVYTRESSTLLRKANKFRIAEQLINLIVERYHETRSS